MASLPIPVRKTPVFFVLTNQSICHKKHLPPMKIQITLICLLGVFLAACQHKAQQEESTDGAASVNYLEESNEAFDARMEWWRDATFGMFIHWGPYAVPAGVYKGERIEGIGEWIMERAEIPVAEYEEFSRQFNPTQYDPDEWARIASDAGMKYMIITSKHHDGFCLWDSEVSDYDAVDYAAIGKDLLAPLKEACEKHGVKLGFYHSIMDWHHPDAQAPHYPDYNTRDKKNPNFDRYVENYLKPQVKELVEKYDPAVLWFDGEWIPEWTHEDGLEMYQFVRSLKPDIIVNNRVDKGRQGMQGMNAGDQEYAGDFGTPEQEILEGTSDFDWESCMTMNDTWGYKSGDDNWKSAETLIHNLIDVTAKGGNYLLNVGPTAEGLIPEASVERLAAMGDWMEVNGEAIYATERLSNFKEGESVYYAQSKDGRYIYVFLTAWPGAELSLTNVAPAEGSQVQLLGYAEPLSWSRNDEATQIELPAALSDPANRPCEHAWVLKMEGKELVQ
jgi:alpha-L-fucosidase